MGNELRERVAVVVSPDLLARSRLDDAARRAGWRVEFATEQTIRTRLEGGVVDLLVLDLDAGRHELLEQIADAREHDRLPARVVGFFSHVDTELAAAARAAGCDAMPRGKMWRGLADLLSG